MTASPPYYLQAIHGAFNAQTGALLGFTTSGGAPYQAVLGTATVVPNFTQLRLQLSSQVQTIFATGSVSQADGGGGDFVFNASDTTSGAWFVGSCAGSVLTVSAVNNGTLAVGQSVNRSDTGATIGTISSFGTGSGGTGTYNLSASATIGGPLIFTADNASTLLVGFDGARWYLAGLVLSNIQSNLVPNASNTYSLGSPTLSFANLYLGSPHAAAWDSVNGIIGYFGRTAAEIAAGVTPTYFGFWPGWGPRYGLLSANSDNTAALQALASQASQTGGAEGYIPPGNYNFASVTSAAACTVGSNTTIRGAGKKLTTFTVTGTNDTAGFFNGTNAVNLKITDLAVVGNSKATGFTDGGALFLQITSAATAQSGNYTVERCAFSNFQATYWLNVTAIGSAVQNFGMTGFRVKDCDFTSLTGNAQNGSSQSVPAHCIAVLGGYAPAAQFKDIEVSGCTADGTFIKGFLFNWGSTTHFSVHHNVLKSFASSAQLSNDAICYVITGYQTNHYNITAISNAASAVVTAPGHTFSNGDYVSFSSILDNGFNSGVPSTQGTLMAALNNQTFGPISGVAGNNFTIPVNTSALATYVSGGACSNLTTPDLYDISFNTFDGMRDCGIYLASTNRVTGSNNTFIGQTSTADGTLPKGAIALNQDILPTFDDNKIYNCAIGISIVPALLVSQNIRNTEIQAIPASGTGIKVNPTGSGTVGEVIIDGLKIDSTAASTVGVQFNSEAGVGLANMEMRNFKINAATCIYQFSVDSTVPALGNVRLFNGLCAGFTNYGLRYSGCSNAGTRAVIENIVFSNPVANSVMANVSNSTGLTVRNLTFNDMTGGTGFAWAAGGAQGRLAGLQFNNVAAAQRYDSSANRLGVDAPNFTMADNDFIQDLNTAVFSGASGKYTRQGWNWDRIGAALIEVRAPTTALGRVTVAYSASMQFDASTGASFEITANNGNAFTIQNPSNPQDGQRISVRIFNTSGGALGAVTWGAAFKMSAWTAPATGNNRSIDFEYNSTAAAWYQTTPENSADVPN